MIDDRSPEIEPKHAAEPVQILRDQRLVEMVFVTDRLERRLRQIVRAVCADVERDRITGNSVDQREDCDGDADERQDGVQEPAHDVRCHRDRLSPPQRHIVRSLVNRNPPAELSREPLEQSPTLALLHVANPFVDRPLR